jgi:hypothetical protein
MSQYLSIMAGCQNWVCTKSLSVNMESLVFACFTARKHGGPITYFQINRDDHSVLYLVKVAVQNYSNDKTDVKMTMIVLHQKPAREWLNHCVDYSLILPKVNGSVLLFWCSPSTKLVRRKGAFC